MRKTIGEMQKELDEHHKALVFKHQQEILEKIVKPTLLRGCAIRLLLDDVPATLSEGDSPAIVLVGDGRFEGWVQGEAGMKRIPASLESPLAILQTLFDRYLEKGSVFLPEDHEVVQWLCTQGGHILHVDAESQGTMAFAQAAKQGDPEAQYHLGAMYFYGKGLVKDEAKAALWFEKAALQDHAKACYALGALHLYGIGLDRSAREAFKYFQKAAQKGLADAQVMMAESYHEGLGVACDEEQEALWMRRAAEQDHVEAQYNLGCMYFYGTGAVPKDDIEALDWFSRAGAQGFSEAQYMLGKIYEELAKDPVQAMVWYLKAAEQGYADAQFSIGHMYRYGIGVERNVDEALFWMRKAAEKDLSARYFLIERGLE